MLWLALLVCNRSQFSLRSDLSTSTTNLSRKQSSASKLSWLESHVAIPSKSSFPEVIERQQNRKKLSLRPFSTPQRSIQSARIHLSVVYHRVVDSSDKTFGKYLAWFFPPHLVPFITFFPNGVTVERLLWHRECFLHFTRDGERKSPWNFLLVMFRFLRWRKEVFTSHLCGTFGS